MLEVGGVKYTPEEQAFAETLRRTLESPRRVLGSQETISPLRVEVASASSDLGDLSWNVPTTEVSAATWVPGTPAHTWQAVACDGMSIGVKGMLVAAKTMALTGYDVLVEPEHARKARAEFEAKLAGFTYKARIADAGPVPR